MSKSSGRPRAALPDPDQIAGAVIDVIREALAEPTRELATQRVIIDHLATEVERLRAELTELREKLAVPA
jgi:hypothetical protein